MDQWLRDQRIETINADHIEACRDELIDERGRSRRIANKLLIVLGAILDRGVRTHGLRRNPARDASKLRVCYDADACDFFSPDEIDKLSETACSDHDRAIDLTAAFTGPRTGERIALRWGDVDFSREAPQVYNSYPLGTITAP